MEQKESIEKHLNNYIPVTESGCYIWMGATKEKHSYGRIWLNGKHVRIHRLAYIHYKGKIPENLHILHKCDVNTCINPDHLYAGTHQDNMQDMVRRKRFKTYIGEAHPNTTLTEEQAKEIKYGYLKSSYYQKKFNVSKYVVSDIRRGKSWKYV